MLDFYEVSNILGLGFIFALQYLLEVPAVGPPPFLPSNFFIIGMIMIIYICIILFFFLSLFYAQSVLFNT